jgi:alkaline shock protein 23
MKGNPMSDAAIPKTGRERENSANTKTDKKPEGPLQTDHGTTTIEENVVAKIAGMAARQVPGVYDMGNAVRRAFSAVTDRIPNAQTNVTGGISVHKGETQAAIDVTVVVEYGVSIIDVCNNIRDNIIGQVEGTTGLEVVEVNITVTDVHLPDDASSNSETTDLK